MQQQKQLQGQKKRKLQAATNPSSCPSISRPEERRQSQSAPSYPAIKEEITSKAGLGLTVQARRRNITMLAENLMSSRPDIDAIAAAKHLEWYCFSNSTNRAVYMHHLCDQRKTSKTGQGRLLPMCGNGGGEEEKC